MNEPKRIPRFVFHDKSMSSIGSRSKNAPITQIVLPDPEKLSIGVLDEEGTKANNANSDQANNIILFSGIQDMLSEGEEKERHSYQLFFYCVAGLNILATIVLLIYGSNYVIPSLSGEIVSVMWTIASINLIVVAGGIIAVAKDRLLLMNIYLLLDVVVFFLTIDNIPFFVYTIRYLFDVIMLVLVLYIKEKLQVSVYLTLPADEL